MWVRCAMVATHAVKPAYSLLAVITVGAVSGGLVARGFVRELTAGLEAPAVVDVGTVLCGAATDHEVVFRNGGGTAIDIDQVTTTCGCVSVRDWSRRLAPGASSRLALTIVAGPLDAAFSSTLSIRPRSGRPLDVAVRGSVQPICMGWPKSAEAVSESGGLVLRVAEAYVPAIREVAVYDERTNSRVDAAWSPEHAEIVVRVCPNEGTPYLTVVVKLGESPSAVWAAPLVVRVGPTASASSHEGSDRQ